MIHVKGLTKSFGSKIAVQNLSFVAEKGEILGLLGPNGAGKSTTMKMLTGFLRPSAGCAEICGVDVWKSPLGAKRRIGYLPESAASYGEMFVSEFLKFAADIRGLKGSERNAALDRVAQQCFVTEVWNQPVETLSKGYRQRVGFAQALLHDPEVLILDEPTDGLDPNQKHEVRQLIKRMSKQKTILLSTHILEEVEQLCKRVVIISRGQLVAQDTIETLYERHKTQKLDVIFRKITKTDE